MKTHRLILPALLPALFLLLASQSLHAGSATWSLNPTDNDWDTAANWTPNTIPDGSDDDATFNLSGTTDVVVTATDLVRTLIFAPGADPFTITVNPRRTLTLLDGIANESGINQTLVALADPGGRSGTIMFNFGATSDAMMTIVTEGNSVANLGNGGLVIFTESSSAEGNTFINQGATVDAGFGGRIIFEDEANATRSNITNEAGTVSGANGGFTSFDAGAIAGSSVIVAEGATASNAFGGLIQLSGGADAGTASLTATSGTNGGRGGRIILGNITGSAQVEVDGNGILDGGQSPAHLSTVGSLTGDGTVKLSSFRSLEIGSNNLSTTFSGTIQDNNSITKVGTGTFTLTGANTYTGGTAVMSGVLLVSNVSGSGTGTGPVTVNGGTLGGSGIISGAVTVGTGGGTGAFLAPASGSRTQVTLILQSSLTLQADATYTYTFKANKNKARTDLVIADGVTINNATLAITGTTQGRMKRGTVLTVISNTSANPISGTFGNLADGAIITVNGNNLQASYEGGDGNDLTLTVVR